MEWSLIRFEELKPAELYAIMHLRSEVFVVEQNCVYLDADGKDVYCHHLLGRANNELAAYARIVPPGISYPQPSIGRVVTSPAFRGQQLGRTLMQHAIKHSGTLYPRQDIRIGAQLYLKKFYASLGFAPTSEVYDEDGIDHIEMTLFYADSKK